MRDLFDFLKNQILILDGAMGTSLQEAGFKEVPELAVLEAEDLVYKIHSSFIEAGSHAVETNTFGANRIKLKKFGLLEKIEEINLRAARIARKAAGSSGFVFGSIGPTGLIAEPIGSVSFDFLYEVFSEQAAYLAKGGVDAFLIETFIDIQEARIAALAAKETTGLPVFVTLSFNEELKTELSATSPEAAVGILESLGVAGVGANCSLGPEQFEEIARRMGVVAEKNTVFQPNAGIPKLIDGKTVFEASPKSYARFAEMAVENGAGILGGCCGSKPEHIAAIKEAVYGKKPSKLKKRNYFFLCTPQNFFRFDLGVKDFLIIGEKINPANRPDLKKDIELKKYEIVLSEAKNQESAGADVLDINVSVPLVSEKETLMEVVKKLAYQVKVPISIDTMDCSALEEALKIYPGRALVNSINAKKKSLEENLKVASRFGAAIIALAVSDKGVPKTKEEKLKALEEVRVEAESLGYSVYDILFDPAVLSAATASVKETLLAIEELKNRGLYTVVGLSNISHGLPQRKTYNRAFAVLAAAKGLSGAILDPYDKELVSLIKASRYLVKLSTDLLLEETAETKTGIKKEIFEPESKNPEKALYEAITSGNKKKAEEMAKVLLDHKEPYAIVEEIISPAMKETGELFAAKKIFLPQVLMTAEAVKKAFEVLKPEILKRSHSASKAKVVLATVEGDVHDIGKSIVGAILEANGYEVYDLGVDVRVEDLLKQIEELKPEVVGLSCLMTTTLASLERTVKEIKKKFDGIIVAVGGAIVTEEVKKAYGADIYAKDAMGFAEILNNLFKEKKGWS